MKNFLILSFLAFITVSVFAQEKPAVIVLTDIGGDPDDEQSMVRLLLYADQLDIKALCATSRLGHGHDIKPEILQKQIRAYGQVYTNLLRHSKGYPEPAYLESVIKEGLGDPRNVGEGYDSEASDYILETIDKSSQLVHVVVWGGLRELAQTLWSAKKKMNPEGLKAFCKKIQVHAIGDQDKHRDWILNNFPDMRYVAAGYIFPGNFGIRQVATFRGMYMTGDVSMQDRKWVEHHILGHGPLSETYPLDGHGTVGMKEGDSPSFLGLLANGLNVPDRPDWGGWGGRFRLLGGNLYIDGHDFLDGSLNERHTVARWRPAFQRSFMARMDWCVKPFAEANHSPEVVVNNSHGTSPIEISAKPGATIRLDASSTHDPDGDKMSFRWFTYQEISGGIDCLPMKITSGGKKCSIKLPDIIPGKVLHLILEVTDSGSPALTSYRRVVIRTEN